MTERGELFHVAYVSRRSNGVTDRHIVDEIVLPSMTRNRRLSLSGCIWFDSIFFFQVLEGVKSDLMTVYQSIEKDRRHHSIRVLSAQAIERRDFERFSMRLIGEEAPVAVHGIISRYGDEGVEVFNASPLGDIVVRRLISEISTYLV